MKRVRGLWPRILDRENLRLATLKALRTKRDRTEVRSYVADLDNNLQRMLVQLSEDSFPLGRYHQFVIFDPKERIITAPCFEERVLHHALMNHCEPVFEKWFIHDTYACRLGKGRNQAVKRAREFAGRNSFFLKMDIRKYFDSISHDRLLDRLTRLFKEAPLLRLFDRIVRVYRGQLETGLPIGSLTSQHFANFYLGHFDRFVKESLRVKNYVRYMDDMVLWGDSASDLIGKRDECIAYLDEQLGLGCKGEPYINRTRHGMDFLGCRVWPTHITLNRRSRIRFRRQLQKIERQYAEGSIGAIELQRRATAMVSFVQAAEVSSWRFRTRMLEQAPGGWSQGLEPGEPRRQLEQHAGELPVGEP